MAEANGDDSEHHSVAVDEQQNAVQSLITDLNDYCVLRILELLRRDDLCAMGQTCTRFEALSADVFVRHHPDKAIAINNISNKGKLEHEVDERYAKCFAKFIPNVTLGKGFTNITLNKLCKLYEDYGCPIKSLEFKNWETLNRSHGVIIRDIIKEVECVTFTGMKIDGDLQEILLQFMPNMKRLTFSGGFNEPESVDMSWMGKTYPKLEYFAWHVYAFPATNLKRFFEANPNIKHFSLYARSMETIKQLIDDGIHVNELFINLDNFDNFMPKCNRSNDPLILDCLKILGEREPSTKMHLKFGGNIANWISYHHMNKFLLLCPYIEGMYFEEHSAEDAMLQTIYKCENLKVLQIHQKLIRTGIYANFGYKIIDWSAIASKLEKVFIYYKYYNQAVYDLKFEEKGLKEIFARNCQPTKLRNGRKSKVYISSLALNQTINDMNKRDDEVIEFVRTETEMVNNPLIERRVRRDRHKVRAPPLDEETRRLLDRFWRM